MSLGQAREEALRILNHEYNLIRDHDALMQGIDTLARITEELRGDHGPEASALLARINDRMRSVQDRAELLLMEPRVQEQKIVNLVLDQLRTRITDAQASPERLPRRYLVEHTSKDAERVLGSLGGIVHAFKHIPYAYVDAADDARAALSEQFSRERLPAYQEKRYHIRPLVLHSQGNDWNLKLIGAPGAWDVTRGKGVAVGVVDTGCDYTHPELRDRFGPEKGHNFITDSDDPMDDHGHGTHCSGTVAGSKTGVAPEATLYALKFLNSGGSGSEVDFIRAAEWAIDHKLDILSGSFGSAYASSAEEAVCDALKAHGILFAAAAGNDGTGDYGYPASYDSVISVAAVDRNKERAPFSQHNDQVNIAAPGVDVYSTIPDHGHASWSGTSMATPHVSGSLALVHALNTDPAYVQDVLLSSAERLGEHDEYGDGLVRPDQAVRTDALLRRWIA